jgi:hypothetical protein
LSTHPAGVIMLFIFLIPSPVQTPQTPVLLQIMPNGNRVDTLLLLGELTQKER